MRSKIIAREFLILIGIIPLLTIAYIYYDFKGENIKKAIISSRTSYDSVMNVFGSHNREYYRRLTDREPFYRKVLAYNNEGDVVSYTYDISIWQRLEKLYLTNQLNVSNYNNFPTDVNDHLESIGIKSFKSLSEAVAYVYVAPEYKKKNEELENQRDKYTFKISRLEKSKIDDQKTFNFLKQVVIWYLSILFGLRYFYFALFWSIRTIRTKDNFRP